MPKNQPTAAKRARTAARAGQKYTTALREAGIPELPPGDKVLARRVRLAADIRSRGLYLRERFPQRGVRGRLVFNDTPRERDCFLHLLYDLVADSRPELVPVVPEGATADGDLQAVDALFAPLDRAVRCFLAQEPPTLWQQQLRAHVEALDATTGPGWQIRQLLAVWYRQAMTLRPGIGADGEPSRPGLPYYATCDTLDAILVTTTGGHAPGTLVRLRDERRVFVLHAQWSDEHGGPDGYLVVPEHFGPDFEVRADQVIGTAQRATHSESEQPHRKTVTTVQFRAPSRALLIDYDHQGDATL